MEQNYKRHARYVPGFHMVTFTVILVSLVLAIVIMVQSGITLTTIFMLLVAAALGLLFAFLRIFSTGNQDRIIRAEENFRSFRLTGKELDSRLTRSQIIALRFACDEEYGALTDRAIKENLTADDIKKAVSQWRADHHRI